MTIFVIEYKEKAVIRINLMTANTALRSCNYRLVSTYFVSVSTMRSASVNVGGCV